MGNMIEIRGLHKSFGQTKVLTGLDLSVREGEIVVIIGNSGCGKSVMLRCIEMLEKPDAGTIIVNGQEITAKNSDINRIRRSVGMVYQDFGLFSNMNVMENLCIAPIKLLKMSPKDARKKALDLLRTVGLADRANSRVSVLSGGQKQRVAICRAMMMDPKIMLFDEPTSALDPTMVGEVLATIRMLSRRGLTMVIVTHEMDFARKIADRVVFLADGGIYEQGTPEEIFGYPRREKTLDFIRKQKHLVCHVDRRGFDLLELQGSIQNFAIKYGLSENECYRLQICAEEMICMLVDSVPDDKIDINMNLSFSETEQTSELTFQSRGVSFNPFEQLDRGDESSVYDHLGLLIIKFKAKQYTHCYENGMNTIMLKM